MLLILRVFVCFTLMLCQIYLLYLQKRRDGICIPGWAEKKAEMDFKSTRWPLLLVFCTGIMLLLPGNMWSNDQDKFGQKLMEKMGWSQGKGLGANEDGRVQVLGAGWSSWMWLKYFYSQHISVKLKDNNKGVGFEGHDDTWLSHQNDFQVWRYFEREVELTLKYFLSRMSWPLWT